MLCNDIPTGNDLLLCTEEDARLWIGSTSLAGLSVLFTDLATERKLIVTATEDSDEWWVPFPELVVGHSYRVQLVTGLITPIRFYPYVLSGTTYVADTTLVDGVNITVVKVWEPNGDSYYTTQDQYVSIP